MSLSRKLGFYTVLTAALTALSWLWQGRLHAALAAEERLTEAAAALVGGLWQGLAAAVILFGAGLYLLRSRREEGKKSPDGAFFAVFGGAALALMLTMLILYGGTETASGNTAAINFMVVVWCLLPVPVLVRQTVLAAALRRENGRAAARPWRIVCLLLAAWMIVLAATGQTARFVREPAAADGYSAEA